MTRRFRAGQPVMWGDLPFIVADAADDGRRIAAVTAFDGTMPDADDEGTAFTGSEDDALAVGCAWFAACDHTATALEAHPVLGPVPICDRCAAKNERMAR